MCKTGVTIRCISISNLSRDVLLGKVIVDDLIKTSREDNINFCDGDILAISSLIAGINEENVVNINQLSECIKSYNSYDNIGIVYPMIHLDNFEFFLRSVSKVYKKITMLLNYPNDESGNYVLSKEKIIMNDINISKDLIDYKDYYIKYDGNKIIENYKSMSSENGCELEVIFCNRPEVILDYSDLCIVCNYNDRDYTYERLIAHGALNIIKLSDILYESILGSGYNSLYGLLGSKKINDNEIVLFPRNADEFINKLKNLFKDLTGKNINIIVYSEDFKNLIICNNGFDGSKYIDLIHSLHYLDSDENNIFLIQNS